MHVDGKGTLSKYAAVAGGVLAVSSGLLQVSGVMGNIVLAVFLLALVLLTFGIYALFTRIKPGRPKRLTLGQVLTKYGKHSANVDCVFSAGDQLRTFFDAGAHDPRKATLAPGTTVRLVTRHRHDGEASHVANNMERLEERIRAHGSNFSHKSVEWDNFMLGGLLFGDIAAVRFYHRTGGRTAAIGEGFLIVDRRRGGYEAELFSAMRVAFDCLWASPTVAGYGPPTAS